MRHIFYHMGFPDVEINAPKKRGIQRSQEVSWRSASRQMIYPQHVARCGVLGLQFVGLSAGKSMMLKILRRKINNLRLNRGSSSGSHLNQQNQVLICGAAISLSHPVNFGSTLAEPLRPFSAQGMQWQKLSLSTNQFRFRTSSSVGIVEIRLKSHSIRC